MSTITILWRLCDEFYAMRCFLRSCSFFFLGGVARGVTFRCRIVALSHRVLMNHFRSSCSMLLKMKCFRVDT